MNYVPEPKFHEGDWITNKGHSYLIADIDYKQRRYLFEVGGYTHEQLNWEYIENADNKYHLWIIQDAKDGDVLWHSDTASNGIFIFKEIRHDGKVLCYCDYDSEDHFCTGEYHTCCWSHDKYVKPATKEQRDLLFQKMHEAGYKWDAEKKELKKIEQKPTAWSEEDERICQCLIEDQEEALDKVEVISNLKKMYEERIDWLKSLKQRTGG